MSTSTAVANLRRNTSGRAWPNWASRRVIDLRREDEHSTAAEAKAVSALGMNYINVPMKGVVAPTDEQIARVLAALDSEGPVLVHCKRGADRTGTVIACYRIKHDHWQRPQALQEAESTRYGNGSVGVEALRHGVPADSVTPRE